MHMNSAILSAAAAATFYACRAAKPVAVANAAPGTATPVAFEVDCEVLLSKCSNPGTLKPATVPHPQSLPLGLLLLPEQAAPCVQTCSGSGHTVQCLACWFSAAKGVPRAHK